MCLCACCVFTGKKLGFVVVVGATVGPHGRKLGVGTRLKLIVVDWLLVTLVNGLFCEGGSISARLGIECCVCCQSGHVFVQSSVSLCG